MGWNDRGESAKAKDKLEAATEAYGPAEDPEANRIKVIPSAERQAPTRSNWLVKGVIRQKAVGVVFGDPGSGKSTIAVDVACHVATGRPWRGLRTKHGPVMIVAAEDADGCNAMLCAWELHHDLSEPAPVDVIAGRIDFGQDIDRIVQEIERAEKRHGWPVVLAVIDTIAACWHGGEDNDGLGAFIDHCRDIAERTGAAIMMVHHPGHGDKGRERGGSVLRGGVDFSIRAERGGDVGCLTLVKLRGGPDGAKWGYTLEPVSFGLDEDGDPLTACVALASVAPTTTVKLSDNQKLVLRALIVAVDCKANGKGMYCSPFSKLRLREWHGRDARLR
jgi:AAA domain